MRNYTKELLIEKLKEEGIVKIKSPEEEPFTLKSGKKSRMFIDIKEASLNLEILKLIISLIQREDIIYEADKIASVAVGGVPIASVLSYIIEKPQIIIRSEKHDRGTQSKIIGKPTGNIILIEDVATSGGSIVSAVNAIREAGGICDTCIVIVNRQEGTDKLCSENNINLISILTKEDFGIKENI